MAFRFSAFSALALAALVAACGASTSGQAEAPVSLDQASALAQFDTVWTTFDQNYSYFDYKHVDWAALREEFRPQAGRAAAQDELNTVLLALLGRLHDAHVRLDSTAGTSIASFTPGGFVNWDKTTWLAYMKRIGWVQAKPDLGYALVPGGAYLAIGAWNPAEFSADDVDAVLDKVRDARALIIDVRPNTGGDDKLAGALASRLTAIERIGDYVQMRNGPAHGDFSPLQARTVEPRGPWQYTRPIILLVGRASSSSNESFISFVRSLPKVVVAGDTTAGQSGNPASFKLSAQWNFTVSRWVVYTADMQPIQDRGIAPGVPVTASAADFAKGVDPVLDYALAALAAGMPDA